MDFQLGGIDYWSPLRAFSSNNDTNSKKLIGYKLKLINYLLSDKHEEITEENFEDFVKTEEFSQLLKIINEYNKVYEKLLLEYNDWAKQLIPYEKYAKAEEKRKADILQKKRNELFKEVFDLLPSEIKNSISDKTLEEQQNIILGQMDISARSIIESFRYEKMEKLKSSDVNLWDKRWIIYWQSCYLKNLGVNILNEKMLQCDSEEDITNYLAFLEQDDVRKYIPSNELISHISLDRERKYEEALKEYYTTRKDFLDAMNNIFSTTENNFKVVYDQVKNKRVCITGGGGTDRENNFVSIMFYTIRENDGGFLMFNFIHESGHVIDQSPKGGGGFESIDDFREDGRKNPYDKAFRKYEKFNETLNDIFTIEAIEVLQKQGIYLIEPKEFTSLDFSNRNTSSITKDLLQPLLQKFRPQVIKAKINAEPEELITFIGEDNFEELVDAINKVDYLLRNGVLIKIDQSQEDTMVTEYFEQIERVKQIYINIDNYYANKFGEISVTNPDLNAKKR